MGNNQMISLEIQDKFFYKGMVLGLIIGALVVFASFSLAYFDDENMLSPEFVLTEHENNKKIYKYAVSNKSNSMLPTMLNKDIPYAVNITSYDDLKEGDMVTYYQLDGDSVLHRIVKIIWMEDGTPRYVLKGDANLVADGDLVTFEQLQKKIIGVSFR